LLVLASWWLLALQLGGCRGPSTPPPPPPPEWVNPLVEAEDRFWRQQVWFVAEPDEHVEALVAESGSGIPIAYLVRPDGRRRGVRLEGPGVVSDAQYVARPGERESLTAASTDDGLRVAIADEGALVVTATDTRGGGRTVLVRDDPSRRLVHPSVDAEREAVYVAEIGPVGGVFRLGVDAHDVQRIVPERTAASPISWRSSRGERIAYVDDAEPAKIVVAEPPVNLPPRPAAEVLREGRLPASLVPVVVEPGGSVVRLATCTPAAPLAWKPSHDDVLRLDVGQTVGFGRAVFCGRGCTELLTGSPDGATRLAARFELDATRDVWTVWFAPDLPVEGGTYATPERAALATEVPACLPALDPYRWMVEPRWHGLPAEQYTHVSFGADLMFAYGSERGTPFMVAMSERGRPMKRYLDHPREAPPAREAKTAGAIARVADGGITWVETATGAESVVLPPSPDRTLIDPAFNPLGTVLYLVDEGAEPGLDHVALQSGELTRIVAGRGLRRPSPGTWSHKAAVGYLWKRDDGHTEVGTVRPVREDEAEAWSVGPMSLAAFEPVWLPVALRDGHLVRCKARDRIELGVDADGGFLRWGELRVPARAAAFDGTSLRVLGDRDGTPVILAELRVDGARAHWWPLGVEVGRGAASWAPAADAEALPLDGPCDPWE
jgi:hypothetical protein